MALQHSSKEMLDSVRTLISFCNASPASPMRVRNSLSYCPSSVKRLPDIQTSTVAWCFYLLFISRIALCGRKKNRMCWWAGFSTSWTRTVSTGLYISYVFSHLFHSIDIHTCKRARKISRLDYVEKKSVAGHLINSFAEKYFRTKRRKAKK